MSTVTRESLLKLADDKYNAALELANATIRHLECETTYDRAKAHALYAALVDGTISGKNKEERDIQSGEVLATNEGVRVAFGQLLDAGRERAYANARYELTKDVLSINVLYVQTIDDSPLPF